MKLTLNLILMQFAFLTITHAQVNPKDQQQFESILQTMEKGWNTKSGQLFSSQFADRHDYIVWTGMYFSNQTTESNAMSHQHIFDTFYSNSDLQLKMDKVKMIREDLALMHVLGATYDHGTSLPENPDVIITMLLEKQNDNWKIISFHNCDIELSFDPAAQNQGPIPMKVMYASWYKS